MPMEREKQKVIVVAVLGILVLGIGAFQFMSGSEETPKKPDKAKESKSELIAENTEDPIKEELKNLISGSLAQRDPFEPRPMPGIPVAATTKPEASTQNPGPERSASGQRIYRGGGNASSGIQPFRPQISGLPDAMQNGAIGGGGNVGLEPGRPLRQPGDVSYNVTGVLVGKKPVAVLQDDSGQQHLVPVGGILGGETEVLAIERGKVTVRHKGKVKVLKMEGGTSGGK